MSQPTDTGWRGVDRAFPRVVIGRSCVSLAPGVATSTTVAILAICRRLDARTPLRCSLLHLAFWS